MKAEESGTVAVLAEKPSVARDIARVLRATKQGEGYLEGSGYVVTWAIGHLVALAQPPRNPPRVAAMATRATSDAPGPLAARHLRQDQRSVRSRQEKF